MDVATSFATTSNVQTASNAVSATIPRRWICSDALRSGVQSSSSSSASSAHPQQRSHQQQHPLQQPLFSGGGALSPLISCPNRSPSSPTPLGTTISPGTSHRGAAPHDLPRAFHAFPPSLPTSKSPTRGGLASPTQIPSRPDQLHPLLTSSLLLGPAALLVALLDVLASPRRGYSFIYGCQLYCSRQIHWGEWLVRMLTILHSLGTSAADAAHGVLDPQRGLASPAVVAPVVVVLGSIVSWVVRVRGGLLSVLPFERTGAHTIPLSFRGLGSPLPSRRRGTPYPILPVISSLLS